MITDELRELAHMFSNVWLDKDGSVTYTTGTSAPSLESVNLEKHIKDIADRIDAEHEQLMAEQFDSLTFDMKPMTDENMAEHGWVRGPLDADGEMWRRGDMSDSNWGVIEGIAYEDGRWLISGHDISAPWIPADSIRHYHAPTVENVLREFTDAILEWSGKSGTVAEVGTWSDIAEEYAAKLRLAESE